MRISDWSSDVCSSDLQGLIGIERALDIAGMVGHHFGERDTVFHGHAGALCEILQHRMRSIAKQGDSAINPAFNGFAVAQNPELPVRPMFDDALRRWMNMLEPLPDLLHRAGFARNGLLDVVMTGHDEIEDFPALEGIMHDVAFRHGPERRRVPAQVFRHLFEGDDRTIGDRKSTRLDYSN